MKKRILPTFLFAAAIAIAACTCAFPSSVEEPTIEELLARIEALEERVAALEGEAQENPSTESLSDQIIADLTTYSWVASNDDGDIGIFEFGEEGDGALYDLAEDGGKEGEGYPVNWTLNGEDVLIQIGGNEAGAFAYNNQDGSPALIYYNGDEIGMLLTPDED